MSTLIAEAEVNRAHLESSAGILGQQQQLEEAARKQVQPQLQSQLMSQKSWTLWSNAVFTMFIHAMLVITVKPSLTRLQSHFMLRGHAPK